MRTIRDQKTLERRCLATLLEFADLQNKRLVLIVENLDMMFREMVDEEAGWHMRQTLQTEPRILLLAAANSRFDDIDNPDRAFYDLFVTRELRPLSFEECAVLWERVSGQARPPETMRGLRDTHRWKPPLTINRGPFRSGDVLSRSHGRSVRVDRRPYRLFQEPHRSLASSRATGIPSTR